MADITKILLRRDSEANWQSVNPVLGLGEPGVAIDKNGNIIGFKIGDGNTTWNDLTYQTGDFSAMAQRVEQLENSASGLTNQVTNLSSTVDNLDSLVTDSENGIEALANKVSAQEVTIADNTRDISNLETNKENISNKVSQLSSESTNTQYPGAKTVYDAIEDVQDNIRAEANARNAQDTLLSDRINSIETLIPDTATSDNKLTDEKFVNSSIATNTATFRGTFNIVTDLDLTTVASEQEIIEALNAKFESLQITPDNNDYCFIAYPNNENPDSFDKYDRYKYSENIWEYEFTLNNSSFTTAQWAAINSGITRSLTEQININTANITNLQNSKQDKLTAGANITIDANNVISATGGSSSAPENMMTTNTNQTITAPKTFVMDDNLSKGFVTIQKNNESGDTTLKVNENQSGGNLELCYDKINYTVKYSDEKIVTYTQNFPTNDGTFALHQEVESRQAQLKRWCVNFCGTYKIGNSVSDPIGEIDFSLVFLTTDVEMGNIDFFKRSLSKVLSKNSLGNPDGILYSATGILQPDVETGIPYDVHVLGINRNLACTFDVVKIVDGQLNVIRVNNSPNLGISRYDCSSDHIGRPE